MRAFPLRFRWPARPARTPAASARTDRVAPWLFIGPALAPEGYAALREAGVTHVIDLRAEASDDPERMAALGLRWLRCGLHDGEPPTDEQLAGLLAWLAREVEPQVDGALLLHCQAGLTRTPTVAMALLMHRGFTLAEAQRLIFAVRPEILPTPAQLAWLAEVDARLHPPAGVSGPA